MTGNLFDLPAEEVVGDIAAEQIGDLHRQLNDARARMRELLRHVGVEDVCRGTRCGKRIVMVRHRNGRLTPYNFDGSNHFITCVDAAQFKRAKESTHVR